MSADHNIAPDAIVFGGVPVLSVRFEKFIVGWDMFGVLCGVFPVSPCLSHSLGDNRSHIALHPPLHVFPVEAACSQNRLHILGEVVLCSPESIAGGRREIDGQLPRRSVGIATGKRFLG